MIHYPQNKWKRQENIKDKIELSASSALIMEQTCHEGEVLKT